MSDHVLKPAQVYLLGRAHEAGGVLNLHQREMPELRLPVRALVAQGLIRMRAIWKGPRDRDGGYQYVLTDEGQETARVVAAS